jgi:hypothetical protein
MEVLKTLIIAVVIGTWFTAPVSPQGLGKKGGYRGPPVDNRPKVDEKAYSAALDRIPIPKQKYDPWGIARPPEPPKPGRTN